MATDILGTDLKLVFQRGTADLAWNTQDLETVSGLDNLVQALTLRLLVDRGDLSGLAHPRYGSRIRDLIGERMDRANRELIRRYVRQALLEDPRVKEVVSVVVETRADAPDSVDVTALVTAITGQTAPLEVSIHAG